MTSYGLTTIGRERHEVGVRCRAASRPLRRM